ncbi:MAG: hypothetical protein ACYCSF_03800 [Acidimicrobiales bacterium]
MASVHGAAGNSDGATVILEGKALAGGNLTLGHWALSLDSFWLVDVLLYAVAVLLAGVHPQLLHLVPAVAAGGAIAAGAWIAQHGRRGWAAVAAGATVVVVLGFPTHAFAEFFLMGPLHITTTLWCLIAAIALRRRRFGWGWVIGVAMLAAGMLGDLQTAVLGVIPIGLAGLVAMASSRQWRAGAAPIAAAVAGAVLAEGVRGIAQVVGTFTIASANPLAPVHQAIQNIGHVLTYGAALEGVGYHPFGAEAVPPLLEGAHAVGLGLGVLAVVIGAVSILWSSVAGDRGEGRSTGLSQHLADPADPDEGRGERFLECYAVFGFFGSCAIFVGLSFSASGAFGRYLTPAVIFGAILAGRLVGKIAGRAHRRWHASLLASLALAVAVGYVASFVSTVRVPTPVQPAAKLASYLAAHHLTRGFGDYWSSSIVTVESSDAVVVRPVIASSGDHRLVRYMRQTSSTWYGGGAEFLVYNAAAPWGGVGVRSATDTFGPPRHVASVGSYRVLTWDHDLSIRRDGR